MLAAHRQGGRTPLIAFAEAWDAYAYRGTGRWRRPRSRRATERELLVLRCHLEASLLEPGEAPADETVSVPQRGAKPAGIAPPGRLALRNDRDVAQRGNRPGDPDRRKELGGAPGWAWTTVVRRLEDYEAVLAAVSAAEAALGDPVCPPASPAAARAS
jgi:hypothetical protein